MTAKSIDGSEEESPFLSILAWGCLFPERMNPLSLSYRSDFFSDQFS